MISLSSWARKQRLHRNRMQVLNSVYCSFHFLIDYRCLDGHSSPYGQLHTLKILLTLEPPEKRAEINRYWLREGFYIRTVNITLRLQRAEKKSRCKLKLSNKSNLPQYQKVNYKPQYNNFKIKQ